MVKLFCRIFFGLSLAVMLGISLMVMGVYYYFSHFAKEEQSVSNIIVQIPYGTSIKRVSELLYENKLIKNPRIYYWYLRLYRKDSSRIQAGYYAFENIVTPELIASRLQTGRDQAYKLVFKEGETLIDLVKSLEDLGLATKESFEEAMKSPEIVALIGASALRPRSSLVNNMGGIEGYLFPDSYFFSRKDSALSVIKKMHQRLLDKLDHNILERMKEQNKSLHEVLTLAAIVEKETGAPVERPLIASVYQNRLKIGMRLQADPTVIYGIKNYEGKIRKVDLLTFHPYNTYKITGLPPGPIASPGLESIRAVLWPATTKYLFFVSKNDGSHEFCENLACHNKAVRTWQIDYFKKAAQQ